MRVPQPGKGRRNTTRATRYGLAKLPIVLLLLSVMVLAQSSALTAQSQSHCERQHCCLLCHAGPLPFLQTNVASAPVPVFRVVWLAPVGHFEPTSDVLLYSSPSRAPPAV